ncbi:30S ribosomal protein S1 [bioreactor metagenome]|uniref:30S ribosomal protein S1 n=1 Tax=bioreactor metagenome TaxID=1076179 RepID=A0A645JWT0_9ZZZZ
MGLEDLHEGMVLTGTVRNVVDFGAFVDIGVKNDGLVHRSEMAERYIKHPMEIVSIGDVVSVRVLAVDRERGKVSLSMKSV